MEKCYTSCHCDNSVAGTTFYSCMYGACQGYKCQSCGAWIVPQYGATCSMETIPKADTVEGELELALIEVEELKSRIALRNRQIRDLRRSLRK